MPDTGKQLLTENPEAPFAAVYFHTDQDGVPATKFSLRSRKGATDASVCAASADRWRKNATADWPRSNSLADPQMVQLEQRQQENS